MAGYIGTSKKTDWNTPAYLLDHCREAMGQEFDLDPCSNDTSLVRAKKSVILPEDGLELNWITYPNIFVNPPFGRDLKRGTSIKDWVQKVSNTYTFSSAIHNIFLLIPAAVDTKVWQDIIFKDGPHVCFIRGRIKFVGAEAHCPMPMAMVYYGREIDRFNDVFKTIGHVI